MRSCLPLFTALLPATLLAAVATAEPLSSNQPYDGELGESVSYEVDFRAVVTPPYHSHKLRVWIPLGPTDAVQQVESHGFKTFPMQVEPTIGVEEKFGNRFAYFEFDEPKGAQIIEHRFSVTTRELRWGVEPHRVTRPVAWPASFRHYLRGDAAVEVTPEIERVLAEFAPGEQPGYQQLTGAMNWINLNLTYDHSRASLQGSSTHAIRERRGHCSDYHGLCSAFGRALNFPTRITYGLALYPKNSPSHCKLEAFLPPYGWVSFDVSETQKLIKKIQANEDLSEEERAGLVEAAKRRLHTGYREDSWLLLTRGSDYELAPKASRPVKVVRTLYAEADGEPLPEPDPADLTKREYGWMTAHSYQASRPIVKPFKQPETLADYVE